MISRATARATERQPSRDGPPRRTVRVVGIDRDDARRLIAPNVEIADEESAPVLISGAEYERLVEERDEREAIAAHAATRDDEVLPHEMVKRLAAGENPIRVWREHRGMTLTQLAEAIGKHKGYLSEIESGKKVGTLETLRAIAAALKVDLEDIAS